MSQSMGGAERSEDGSEEKNSNSTEQSNDNKSAEMNDNNAKKDDQFYKAANDSLSDSVNRNEKEDLEKWWAKIKYESEVMRFRNHEASLELRDFYTKLVLLGFFFVFLVVVFIFVSIKNPAVYDINPLTLDYMGQFFNALILLLIPFFLGVVGSFTRVLISGLEVLEYLPLMVASGLISTFSWVGIKSGVLMKIVAPHINGLGLEDKSPANFETQFYTMVLVALVVGMFSSNVYIFVNEKIELILAKKKTSEDSK